MNACRVMISRWKIRPAELQYPGERAEQPAGTIHERDQDENHFTRIQIAEQTQCQRNRLGEQLDHVEQQVGRKQVRADRMREELPGVAHGALDLEAVENDEQQHRERKTEGGVQVGRRHDAQVVHAQQLAELRQHIHRHQVHQVPEEHPAEDRQRQRRDHGVASVEGVFHLFVDELNKNLGEILQTARHAAGGPARRQPHDGKKYSAEGDGEKQRVDVDLPQALTLTEIGQVMNDVVG